MVNRLIDRLLFGTHLSNKRRGKALKELADSKISDTYFRLLIEKAPDGIVLVGSDGRLSYASPSAKRIFGYSDQIDIFPHPAELTHPEDLPVVLKTLERIVTDPERVIILEYRFKKSDGTWLWVESTFSNQFAEPGIESIVINFRDITQRKQAECALNEKESLLRTFFENAPFEIWARDKEGKGILENKRLVNHFGSILGKKPSDSEILPEVLSLWNNNNKRVLAGEIVNDECVYIIRGEEKTFEEILAPIMIDGSVQGIAGFNIDITDRKKVEDALHKSEEKYRLLIDNQGEGVATVDLDEVFIFANPAADQMFGVSAGTLVGRSLFDFILPDDILLIKEQSAKRAKFEKSSYEIQIISESGESRYILVTAAPYTDSEGEISGTFGIFRDITERKIADQKILNSEKKYRELANSLPVGIFESDLNGVITFTNETLMNWLGYNEEVAISGFSMLQFILESEREKAQKRFTDLVTLDLRTTTQYTAIRKDGSSFPVLVSVCVIKKEGTTVGIRGTLTDMTEQKRVADKLRVLSQTVEQNSASIIITDARGKIEFVNNAFTVLSQYTLEEVIQRTPRIFNRGHIPDANFDLMWETLLAGKVWKGEYQNRRKDKFAYWEDVTISSLMNSEGIISNFILVMSDITEKKKMLDDLISAKESAEESNRLKSAFLAMMNHELRTPLTHILGFSELIMSGVAVEDNVNFATNIQSSGQNLLAIIEGVFDLALMDNTKIKVNNQTFSLMDHYMENKASFDQILRISSKESQINLTFRPDIDWLSSYITADRQKINQILINLFKNAVKFTNEGIIEFGFHIVDGSNISFYVKDTGIGITSEKQQVIFDYFTQADDSYTRVYGGIGVGLAISKKIASILNGELAVESTPGVGSLFTLTLPVKLAYIKD